MEKMDDKPRKEVSVNTYPNMPKFEPPAPDDKFAVMLPSQMGIVSSLFQ
jgi:hypothetical protein